MGFKYATDILIFSVDSRKNDNCRELPKKYFSILLVKREKEPFKNKWCLPGGFVSNDETSYDAAKRILKKETNLKEFYMEELGIYDDIHRDPRGRIITNAYISLIDKSNITTPLSSNAKWFDIEIKEKDNKIMLTLKNEDSIYIEILKSIINIQSSQYNYKLIKSDNISFDHGLIINNGIIELREKANYTEIIFNMMPKEFTIGELKQVFEIILSKKLINSAFRRTISNKIKPIEEKIKTGGHRPSQKFMYQENKQ